MVPSTTSGPGARSLPSIQVSGKARRSRPRLADPFDLDRHGDLSRSRDAGQELGLQRFSELEMARQVGL